MWKRLNRLSLNVPIHVKGAAIVALPAGSVLVVLLWLGVWQRQVELAQLRVIAAAAVQAQARHLMASVLGAESAAHDSFLAGTQPQRYRDFRAAASGALRTLARSVAGNAAQQARIHELSTLLANQDQSLDELLRSQRVTSPAAQLDLLRRSRPGGERLRLKAQEFLALENQLLSTRNRELAHRLSSGRALLWVGSALATVGVLLATVLFFGLVTRRLQKLIQKAGDLELGHPPGPPADERDEIGELDKALHQMSLIISERDARSDEGRTALSEALLREAKATRARSELLTWLSHAIRTSIHSILGRADLLWETGLQSVQTEHVRTLRKAGETLVGLMNNVLDLSRAEADRLHLNRAPFEVQTVLGKLMESLEPAAHNKGLEIVGRIGPGVPARVAGDVKRLLQVLSDLCGNAMDFIAQGEIAIVAEIESGQPDPALLHFHISTTGRAVALEEGDFAEENFEAGASTVRSNAGNKLEMVVCQKLIELMQGRVWIEKQADGCRRMHLVVRLSVPHEISQKPAPGLKRARILLIDRSEADRTRLREMLVQLGGEATEASGGEKGLELMRAAAGRATPYAWVLLDDVEWAQRIAEDPAVASSAIVLFTSEIRSRQRIGLVHQGISPHLQKPSQPSGLLQALDSARRAAASRPKRTLAGPHPAEEPLRLAHSLRILLAEDSVDHIKLVERYLREMDCRIDTADDGESAVSTFQSRKYDVVLMDLQMPRIDGYTATRRMREWELGARKRRTPILALTAHALAEAEEKAIAAGCDAFLTKPVQKASLLLALAGHATASAEPIEVSIPPILREMAPEYLKRRRGDLPVIESALDRGDFNAIRVLGHQLKGSGGGYGFEQLSEIGRLLEESAKQQDPARIRLHMEALSDFLDRVRIVTAGEPCADVTE